LDVISKAQKLDTDVTLVVNPLKKTKRSLKIRIKIHILSSQHQGVFLNSQKESPLD